MAFVGNTVRLVSQFRNFDGVLTDPSAITLKFFDARRKQIGAAVTLGAPDKVSTGVYSYDYTIPDSAAGAVVYEFTATVDLLPSVGRGQIPIRWV